MVDVPKWDFNWQQLYSFREGEDFGKSGDSFRLTCEYDNSETNQPVVNGERLTPRRVKWGDGSFDEMCLNYITVVEPFEPAGSKCSGLESCREQCSDDNSFTCLSSCLGTDLNARNAFFLIWWAKTDACAKSAVHNSAP